MDDNDINNDYGKYNDLRLALNSINELQKEFNKMKNELKDQEIENDKLRENIGKIRNIRNIRMQNGKITKKKIGGKKRRFDSIDQYNYNDDININKKRRISIQFVG